MKPLERPTRRVASRAGIIVFAAMMVLVLSSASARRAGPLMYAAGPRGRGKKRRRSNINQY